MVLFLSEFLEFWIFGENQFGSLVKYMSNSNKSHPKARPETTQKAPKVNLGVPRSKEAPKVGSRRCSSCFGVPLYMQKAQKYCACRQNRASRNSEGHRGTQRDTEHTEHTEHTDAFPTHEVLLGAPLLRAPGARMTVVELTPSNYFNIFPLRRTLQGQ